MIPSFPDSKPLKGSLDWASLLGHVHLWVICLLWLKPWLSWRRSKRQTFILVVTLSLSVLAWLLSHQQARPVGEWQFDRGGGVWGRLWWVDALAPPLYPSLFSSPYILWLAASHNNKLVLLVATLLGFLIYFCEVFLTLIFYSIYGRDTDCFVVKVPSCLYVELKCHPLMFSKRGPVWDCQSLGK